MASVLTLNSYSVYCITENTTVYSYGYQEAPPTVCPHDNTHTIDTNTIQVINTYQIPSYIRVIDRSETGGNVLAYGVTATFGTTTPGTVQEFEVTSLPMTVRILNLSINPGEENLYDCFSMFGAPNTEVGALTATLNSGSNTIQVNDTAYANTSIGYKIGITGGGNNESFPFVTGKETLAGPIYQLTLSSNAVNTYASGSLVDISIPRIINYHITSNNPIVIADKAPGTSLTPPNMSAKFYYTNNDGKAKILNIVFDVFY